jgi:ATP-binding cassette subfamily C (CFTR/MRP) protein 4
MSSEWEQANMFQKWTFSVANIILDKGEKNPLQFNDFLLLPDVMKTELLYSDLKQAYLNSKKFWLIPRLMIAQNIAANRMVCLNILFTFMESSLKIASPVVLGLFLQSLVDKDTSAQYCYGLAALLGGMSLLQTLAHGFAFFFAYKAGIGWKLSSIALIFNKLFRVNQGAFANGTGKLVNLISNDVSRFENWGVFQVFFWETYLEIIVIFVILTYSIGVYPTLAGVGSSLILLPFQLGLASQFATQRTNTANETDSRVRHTSEVIEGITSVKSFGWELPFTRLIGSYRVKEAYFIWRSQLLRAVFQGIYYSSSTISTFVTFSVFWAEGKALTVPIVFATLSMLQQLRYSINRSWQQSIETGSEAAASCNRIDAFLETPDSMLELQGDNSDSTLPRSVDNLLEIHKSSFCYGDVDSKAILEDVDFHIKAGELVIIIGKVGCGKSSYLSAILGEMTVSDVSANKEGRRVHSDTRVAYCAQRPWILASSVCENITFAGENEEQVDEELYRLAVESCCIVPDLEGWPAYDDTEIGERGVSVSGGQKARIALARAVYSNAPLCLLDDPLSAVDANVSRGLFFDCIMGALRNRGKGVVLATHQLQYLPYADRIIVLDAHGFQRFSGTYTELQMDGKLLLSQVTSTAISVRTLDATKSITAVASESDLPDAANGGLDTALSKIESRNDLEQVAVASKYDRSRRQAKEAESEEQAGRRQIIQKEDQAVGQSSIILYWRYLVSGGLSSGILTIILAFLAQVISMICDYWVRWWASSSFGPQQNISYLWTYAILTAVAIVFGYIRAIQWFDFTLRASCSLHDQCLQGVVRAPLQFFVANPTGRILNRFSRDMNIVDEIMPMVLFDFIQSALLCFSAFLLVFIAVPYMLCILPPLIFIIVKFRTRYVASCMEVKRIEAVLRSPIYANFSATLEGLVTLRAYKMEGKMRRVFFKLLDDNSRGLFAFMMINRLLLPPHPLLMINFFVLY